MYTVERNDVAPEAVRAWTSSQVEIERSLSPFLKLHMRNGDLFVLEDWRVESGTDAVMGRGSRYDPDRREVGAGDYTVPIDSVALFETNVLKGSGAQAALTVMAGITVGIGIICAVSPKTCFGSCPTFYLGDPDRPVAEGFSASIAPSLEATDIDALFPRRAVPGPLEIVMKNEALETHVVRHVDLLAVPHRPGTRVFAAPDGSFREATSLAAPVFSVGPEGDVLPLVRDADHAERFSPADSTCLAARETLEFGFDPVPCGACGVVIGCRQTLLSTFVLYQTFAFMGRDAGHWMAELERGKLGDAGTRLVDMLGGAVVRVETRPGVWKDVGEIREFGPIAVDHHLVEFDAPDSWTGRVQIELTKGGWRIDDVALATLGDSVEPLRLAPVDIARDSASDPAALAALLDPERSLTTLPGDVYTLLFSIPEDGRDYDVFIESRGYYLEWIRDEWMREESVTRLAEMFFDPDAALTRLAPEYKRVEPAMEAAFWSSRYAKP
jgi:hypothetical protein